MGITDAEADARFGSHEPVVSHHYASDSGVVPDETTCGALIAIIAKAFEPPTVDRLWARRNLFAGLGLADLVAHLLVQAGQPQVLELPGALEGDKRRRYGWRGGGELGERVDDAGRVGKSIDCIHDIQIGKQQDRHERDSYGYQNGR